MFSFSFGILTKEATLGILTKEATLGILTKEATEERILL
jgi:hypothetical protein